MIKVLLSRWILKKGGINVLLAVGDLIVKITPNEKDDQCWKKIKPIIKSFR